MFTLINKGFTIITNFGCNDNCTYCISKHHPILQNQLTENIDWNYLETCIRKTSSPKVNISGGGDPFFNYELHTDFYYRVKELCLKHGKLLDAHTRIIPTDLNLLRIFNKIALSVEYNSQVQICILESMFPLIRNIVKIRAIQVVDPIITRQQCLSYIDKMHNIGIKQITFRQMFGNQKASRHFEELKAIMPQIEGVMFLSDDEYHSYYFTTNNTLYPYFFGNSIEDREKFQKLYENIEQKCA